MTPEERKKYKASMDQMAKDGTLAKMLENMYRNQPEMDLAQQMALLQQINDEEEIDMEQVKEIREVTKVMKSKIRKRDTKPDAILEFLFKLSPYAKNDTYMRPTVDAGVLDVLYLLATHPNPKIQFATIFLLGELSVNEENAQRMMKEGEVEIALKAGESNDQICG